MQASRVVFSMGKARSAETMGERPLDAMSEQSQVNGKDNASEKNRKISRKKDKGRESPFGKLPDIEGYILGQRQALA